MGSTLSTYLKVFNSIGFLMDTLPFVIGLVIAPAVVNYAHGRFSGVTWAASAWGRPSRWLGLAGVVIGAQWGAFALVTHVDFSVPATRYGDNYSREKFNELRIGDSMDRVYQLLGSPLKEFSTETDRILFYSAPDGGALGSYWARCVFIDLATGNVRGKLASFYTGV